MMAGGVMFVRHAASLKSVSIAAAVKEKAEIWSAHEFCAQPMEPIATDAAICAAPGSFWQVALLSPSHFTNSYPLYAAKCDELLDINKSLSFTAV
jgi:hypothetical protein